MHFFLMAFFFAFFGFLQQASASITTITSPDEITEEWLITVGLRTGYTEHVRHFKRLFKSIQIRTFLEFGVGFSTKYFIDNCQKVISVEFVTPGTGPEWLKYCIELYRNYPTWQPIAYFAGKNLDISWAQYMYLGAESVYQAAAYQPAHYKSYSLIDPSFLEDLTTFINLMNLQIGGKEIDVAFVDCGIYIRGDLVQVLFDKVPIIVAHDIAPKNNRDVNDVYGYGRVIIPENYEEIHVPSGQGTAFWIKKETKYQEIICDLQDYVKELDWENR
jgi:hypothetical protein